MNRTEKFCTDFSRRKREKRIQITELYKWKQTTKSHMKKPNCLVALQIKQLVSLARWLEHYFSICGMNHKSSLSDLKIFLFKRWCNKQSTSTLVYTTRNTDLNITLLKAFQFTCHTELELFQFKSQSLKHLLIKKDMADTVVINELCWNGKLLENCTIK